LNTADREGIWIEVYGTRGSAVFRTGFQYDQPHLAVVRLKNGRPTPLAKIPALPKRQSPQDHFVRAIRNGHAVPASGEEGARIMEILDAVYRSAETGKEVRVRRRTAG
jgi:predicted dehydrogenase